MLADVTEAAPNGDDGDGGANALVTTNNAAFDGDDGDDGDGGTGMLADVSDVTDAAPNLGDGDVGTDVLADVADVTDAAPIGDDDDDVADVLVDTINAAFDGDDEDKGTGIADATDVTNLTNAAPNGDDGGDDVFNILADVANAASRDVASGDDKVGIVDMWADVFDAVHANDDDSDDNDSNGVAKDEWDGLRLMSHAEVTSGQSSPCITSASASASKIGCKMPSLHPMLI